MPTIDYSKYPLPPRKRHHTNPSYYIPASDLAIIPVGYPPLINDINWSDYFTNQLPPDILDIGCGRGLFLLAQAER